MFKSVKNISFYNPELVYLNKIALRTRHNFIENILLCISGLQLTGYKQRAFLDYANEYKFHSN